MKIIFDTMGGDQAPQAIVEGGLRAEKELGIEAYFVGEMSQLKDLLPPDYRRPILEASQVISNEEDPARAIRKKPNSSIVLAMKALVAGDYDGFLSAGSTGGLLAGGLFISKRIKGFSRAALPVALPNLRGPVLLLDSGANMDCSGKLYLNFARMGRIYAQNSFGIENPKVGLLNIGVEEGKGDKRTQEAFDYLKRSDLNFIGNVEARDIFTTEADVVVTDGFAGNILLKTVEGTAGLVMGMVKNQLKKNPPQKEAAAYVQTLLGEVSQSLDYQEVGGAPLLGINHYVMKAHGNSDSKAIFNTAKQLKGLIEKDMITQMKA
ncbi:MAG: phosphate acyltransferase PlsX [Tissierellia bacterium]|nr:phosphate acyltransferase PlsX [Tissierellia bacterium]